MATLQQTVNRYNQLNSEMQSISKKLEPAINDTYQKVRNITDRLLDTAGSFARLSDRLEAINDGRQPVQDMENMIFQSAQNSHSGYLDMYGNVTQLGTDAGSLFGSSQEIIGFANQLTKQFSMAGASQERINELTAQMSAALSDGVIQGSEFDSLLKAAPGLIQTVADTLGMPVDQLSALAAQGQLSAATMKDALLSAADQTNQKFGSMPMTIEQIWSVFHNNAVRALQPAIEAFGKLTTSSGFQDLMQSFSIAITVAAEAAGVLLNAVSGVAGFILNNWAYVSPIIWGIVAAFAAYKLAMLYFSVAAKIADIRQNGLNLEILKCPLTWIVFAIIAVLVVMQIVITYINKTQNSSATLFGVLAGCFTWLWGLLKNTGLWIANVGLGIWNALKACAENVKVAFLNTWNLVQQKFWQFVGAILNGVKTISDKINNVLGIFGISIDTMGIEAQIQNVADKQKALEGKKLDYQDVGAAWQKGFGTYDAFGENWSLNSYMKGRSWGDNLVNGLKDKFSDMNKDPGDDNFKDLLDDVYNNNSLNNDNLNNIANDTSSISDSMDIAEEDLQYMRDLAEQEAINRFTTADLRVEFTANNSINSNLDIDGVCDYMANRTAEQLALVAEGVH